jgi:nucleoside phosphorylase
MILVPNGPEHSAVRRGCSGSKASASVLAVPAGRASASALERASGSSFVILGLCGALDPALRVGEAVVCESVSSDGATIAFDAAFTAEIASATGARAGRALTVDHVVAGRGERAALFGSSGAAIVEMEGFYLARSLLERGCTVAMLRIVSDDASYDLPDIAGAVGADGTLRPLALLGAFVRAPRSAVRFIGDARRGLAALERTTRRLISR